MLKWSDNAVPLGGYPVPVISLRRQPGPTILILGGTPGNEFNGSAAIMRVASKLDPSELTGQVILVPTLNVPAVQASTRVSPLDGQNLNRAFPGDADSGPTAMLAHIVETELPPRADAAIDLYSGDKASAIEPRALAARTDDPQLTVANMNLAHTFGLPLIWVLGIQNDNRTVNAAAAQTNTPMIATELCGDGGVDPKVTDLAETGLMHCLTHLDRLSGKQPKPVPAGCVEIANPLHTLCAPSNGLFDRNCSAGHDVERGQNAGTLRFPTGPDRAPNVLSFAVSGWSLPMSIAGWCAMAIFWRWLLYLWPETSEC